VISLQEQFTSKVHPIKIHLKNNSERELETRNIIDKFLSDTWVKISPYWFAPKELIIEQDIIPHSHPIITISCRVLGFKKEHQHLYLSDLIIHENMHHWLKTVPRGWFPKLKKLYPEEGEDFVGKPKLTEHSYWIHIPIIWNTHFILKNKILSKSDYGKLLLRKKLPYDTLTRYIVDNFEKVENELSLLNLKIHN
jgi:hypothetical protein